MLWDEDSPRARRNDPLTSHAAADSSNLADSQQAVLTALRVHKHLAAFELETVLPMWSPSRIRTALTELAKQGLVERTDSTRMTPYGRDAHVWQVA
jgi:predicted transcriptional regulator